MLDKDEGGQFYHFQIYIHSFFIFVVWIWLVLDWATWVHHEVSKVHLWNELPAETWSPCMLALNIVGSWGWYWRTYHDHYAPEMK